MIELIYTSSRNGLKPGSSGFTSVAWTRGIPPHLIEPLESLSSYKHVFIPGTPGSEKNPVCFSYQTMRYGEMTFPVISRIADAGLDYTSRSNKIAHHIVPRNAELSVSPAEVCLEETNFISVWNKPPELLPERKLKYDGPPLRNLPAETWLKWKGDAGWAGVIAKKVITILQGPKDRYSGECIYFEYDLSVPSLDLVRMIAEVTRLLPPKLRQDCTFSTYFVQQKIGVSCLIRCALSDCLPLRTMKNMKPESVVVIHTKEAIPDSFSGEPLVQAARSGDFSRLPGSGSRTESPDHEQEPLLVAENPVQMEAPLHPLIPDDDTIRLVPSQTVLDMPIPKQQDFHTLRRKQNPWKNPVTAFFRRNGKEVPVLIADNNSQTDKGNSSRNTLLIRLVFVLICFTVIFAVLFAIIWKRAETKMANNETTGTTPFAEYAEQKTNPVIPQLPQVQTKKHPVPAKKDKPDEKRKEKAEPETEQKTEAIPVSSAVPGQNIDPQKQSEIFLFIMRKLSRGKTEQEEPLPVPENVIAISAGSVSNTAKYETESFSLRVENGAVLFQILRDAAYDETALQDLTKTGRIVFHTKQNRYRCPLKINDVLLAELQPKVSVSERYSIQPQNSKYLTEIPPLKDFLEIPKPDISLNSLYGEIGNWNNALKDFEETDKNIPHLEKSIDACVKKEFPKAGCPSGMPDLQEIAADLKQEEKKLKEKEEKLKQEGKKLKEKKNGKDELEQNKKEQEKLAEKLNEQKKQLKKLYEEILPVFAVCVKKDELEKALKQCRDALDAFPTGTLEEKKVQDFEAKARKINEKGYKYWRDLVKNRKNQSGKAAKLNGIMSKLKKEAERCGVWSLYKSYCENEQVIPLEGPAGEAIREKLAEKFAPQYQYKAK